MIGPELIKHRDIVKGILNAEQWQESLNTLKDALIESQKTENPHLSITENAIFGCNIGVNEGLITSEQAAITLAIAVEVQQCQESETK